MANPKPGEGKNVSKASKDADANIDMNALMSGNSELSYLMQTAAKIKGAQMAGDRKRFDSWPTFYQNTLFHKEDITALRDLPFPGRLDAANQLRLQANEQFKKNEHYVAVTLYEQALALFTWAYFSDTTFDWRKGGLKDSIMAMDEYTPANEEERALVNELKISVYNNIAITQFQLKTYNTAIQACDYCLAISPTNVKALYRRAHCRLDNPQISTTEHEMALADLVAASKADPSNTAIARQIKELRMAAKKQNEIDKKTFTGLFERGAVYDKEVPSGEEEKKEDPDDKDFLVGGDADETAVGEGVGSSEKKTFAVSADGTRKFTKEDVIKNIKEHEVCVQYLKKNKRFKEAEEMVEKVRLMKLRLQQMTDTVDFMNPSAEMIEDAKRNGIDLNDMEIRKYMAAMQEHKKHGDAAGGTLPPFDDLAPKPSPPPKTQPTGMFAGVNRHILIAIAIVVFFRIYQMRLLPLNRLMQWLSSFGEAGEVGGGEEEVLDLFDQE